MTGMPTRWWATHYPRRTLMSSVLDERVVYESKGPIHPMASLIHCPTGLIMP